MNRLGRNGARRDGMARLVAATRINAVAARRLLFYTQNTDDLSSALLAFVAVNWPGINISSHLIRSFPTHFPYDRIHFADRLFVGLSAAYSSKADAALSR